MEVLEALKGEARRAGRLWGPGEAPILKSAWLGGKPPKPRAFQFSGSRGGASLYSELPRPKFVRTKDFSRSESLK